MLKECALSGYLFSVFIGSISHFQSLLLHCDSDTCAVEESKRGPVAITDRAVNLKSCTVVRTA